MNTTFSSIDGMITVINDSKLRNEKLRLSTKNISYDGKSGLPIRYTTFSDIDMECLVHDAGHAIDFIVRGKPERLSMNGFGFGYTQDIILGNFYDVPSSTQGVHAECRAFAYQLHLLQAMAYDVPINSVIYDFANLICNTVALEDSYNIPRRTRSSKDAAKRHEALRNIKHKTMEDIRLESGALSETVSHYRTERVQYAIKNISKYYHNVNQEDVVQLWHEMIGVMDKQLEK